QVSFQCLTDLLFRRRWVPLEEKRRGHDHARRTEAALQSVLLMERSLDWVQLRALGEPLDRRDRCPVGLHRENRARFDSSPVQMNRTCPTLAGIAADVGTGQTELVAQEGHEQCSRLDVLFMEAT